MQLEQEIQGRLEKEKEQNYIDKLKKECGHSLEINLQKKMDMNIPDHLLNPTGQVSIKDSENTITPSAGSSSKRTFGPISSSPAEKCVELQVPSPSHISTPTGAGKGMPAKSHGKGGSKQSLYFRLQDL